MLLHTILVVIMICVFLITAALGILAVYTRLSDVLM